ncbi:uncharacterized protein TRIVIDRAFT_40792 [Trichoderma virens Gv29-8]|uniref:F-box domain-containing protein n=1 Tax=Hypocrea virens (strain Gv29-8 / FGSC 10586) TaxID=413071 RepID=G9N9B1_HYPVG|nr:uncharacterized protein TRIVIDRAFT_40792 [Trichoderma virens Gv29-8]EHK16532.1 hypothetical protein TRIVIDRAFT_40792 [Trichoderma virens Gv29-8]UKZ52088.1 hypothetical protein TrVGV298_005858 [Trichoderma virens]
MSLCSVPSEILRLIAVNLGPDDLFHLAISSRQFKRILEDKVICRKVLESIRYSSDYTQERETGDYDKALRRLIKRREALQMARPFHVLQVSSEALQFTYTNGAVCYTTMKNSPTYQRHLRVLVLEGPSVKEVSIDIPSLIKASDIPNFDESLPYQFRPLYHADGIVSCLYEQKRSPGSSRSLIIYNLKEGKILDSHSLSSTANIFVRNNSQYLYYGTKSYPGSGQRRWMLEGFSLEHSTWLRRIVLWDLAGSDMGSTICFEIFGDHLYGVSSQELTEAEDSEWDSPAHALDSYYYAFRLPLKDPSRVQVLPRSALWRRGATDGPIDDRWCHLQLGQDEKSGQISIFETRKEWLSSWSRRTCYQKQLDWPSIPQSTDGHPEDDCSDGQDDAAHCETAPEDSVHRGDTGFSSSTFDFRNSPVRSYNPSCQAFVDIVSSTTASSPTAKRLRLRSEDQYVRLWPADQGEQGDKQPNQSLDHYVDELLNPQAHFDEVDFAMDERVLVYSPKSLNSPNDPRSIVLVSFDPALHFQGLSRCYGHSTPPYSMGHQLNHDGNAHSCGSSMIMDGEIAADYSSKIHGVDLSLPRGTGQRTRASSTSTPKTDLTGFRSRKKPRLEGACIPNNKVSLHCG